MASNRGQVVQYAVIYGKKYPANAFYNAVGDVLRAGRDSPPVVIAQCGIAHERLFTLGLR